MSLAGHDSPNRQSGIEASLRKTLSCPTLGCLFLLLGSASTTIYRALANRTTKVLQSAKQPFNHNGTTEGQWTTVRTERRKGTFSPDFSITESVMSNLTHRQRGILTQDFYIIAECSNQRVSDKRVP